MTAGAAWTQVLLAPLRQRRNHGSMWFWQVLIGVSLIAPLVLVWWRPGFPIGWVLASELAAWAFGGWIWLVNSLMVQNEPHAARFVPGQVRTLRRVLLGAGLSVVAVGALVGACFGQGVLTLLIVASSLLVLAWGVRVPAIGMLGWIVPTLRARWADTAFVTGLQDAIVRGWQIDRAAFASVWALALAAATWWSLHRLLRDGDMRHQRSHRQRAACSAAQRSGRGQLATSLPLGRAGTALRGAASAFYQRRLARVSAVRGGSVLGRALVGLGPSVHWTGMLGSALVYGTIAALVMFLAWDTGAFGPPRGRHIAIAWPLALAALTYLTSWGLSPLGTLHHTRREQALLMLVPGMPRATALNRRLVGRLLVQFLLCWSAGMLGVPLMAADGQSSDWLVTLGFAALPTGAWLVRDWSRLAPPSPMTSIGPFFLSQLVGASAIVLQVWTDVTPRECVAVFIGAAVIALAWRWRALQDAPAAWPAGRR